MILRKFLRSCDIDAIAPFFKEDFGRQRDMLLQYKKVFDILCHMEPVPRTEDDEDIYIGVEDDGDGGIYVSAYALEGDYWECLLGQEFVIEGKATCSKERIAASCLYHLTFYGFSPQEVEDKGRRMFGGGVRLRELHNDLYLL